MTRDETSGRLSLYIYHNQGVAEVEYYLQALDKKLVISFYAFYIIVKFPF